MLGRLLSRGKGLALRHKKKIILVVLAVGLGYFVKRKMTLEHVLSLVNGMHKIIQHLPLPESPSMREMSEYEHPSMQPLRQILEVIGLDELKARLGRKEATWEELSEAITVGAVVGLTLYNVRQFYFVVQNKYDMDFKQLGACAQFEEAMYVLRKHFTDQIPSIFTYYRGLLREELKKIGLVQQHDHAAIVDNLTRLVDCVFSSKYTAASLRHGSSLGRADPEVSTHFTTPNEYTPPKPKHLATRVLSSAFSLLGKCLSLGDLFPSPQIDPVGERYSFCRDIYIINLKQAPLETVRWPNDKAEQLFSLVLE